MISSAVININTAAQNAPSSYQTVNGLFITAVGEGLYILLSAGTQVSGHLTYRVNYA